MEKTGNYAVGQDLLTPYLPAKTELDGSEEEFITEHYWGYTKINNNRTSEYAVEHPKWEVYPTKAYSLNVDFGDVYGSEFDFLKKRETARSVFLAEGSAIRVLHGRTL